MEIEAQTKNNLLVAELEKYMDVKREMGFELQMLKDQNGRIAQREINRMLEQEHKIDVIKLNQGKIQ